MTRYTVTAERGKDRKVWVFQCQEFPGAISQSRRLADAKPLMSEAIGFVAEVDPDSVEIDLVFELPNGLSEQVRQTREALRALELQQREIAEVYRETVRQLRAQGLTGVDTAAVLGISPQRVSQISRSPSLVQN